MLFHLYKSSVYSKLHTAFLKPLKHPLVQFGGVKGKVHLVTGNVRLPHTLHRARCTCRQLLTIWAVGSVNELRLQVRLPWWKRGLVVFSFLWLLNCHNRCRERTPHPLSQWGFKGVSGAAVLVTRYMLHHKSWCNLQHVTKGECILQRQFIIEMLSL